MGSLASVVAGCVLCDMPVQFGGVWGRAAASQITMLPILPTPSFYNLVQCSTKEAECQAYKILLNYCILHVKQFVHRVLTTYGYSGNKGIITVEGEENEGRDGNEGSA